MHSQKKAKRLNFSFRPMNKEVLVMQIKALALPTVLV
jgi:hypothetical protein